MSFLFGHVIYLSRSFGKRNSNLAREQQSSQSQVLFMTSTDFQLKNLKKYIKKTITLIANHNFKTQNVTHSH